MRQNQGELHLHNLGRHGTQGGNRTQIRKKNPGTVQAMTHLLQYSLHQIRNTAPTVPGRVTHQPASRNESFQLHLLSFPFESWNTGYTQIHLQVHMTCSPCPSSRLERKTFSNCFVFRSCFPAEMEDIINEANERKRGRSTWRQAGGGPLAVAAQTQNERKKKNRRGGGQGEAPTQDQKPQHRLDDIVVIVTRELLMLSSFYQTISGRNTSQKFAKDGWQNNKNKTTAQHINGHASKGPQRSLA